MIFIVMCCILKANYLSGIMVPYQDTSSCDKDNFFQDSSLQCIPCGSNQKTSDDSRSCVCSSGFKITEKNGGPKITCEKCNNGDVVSRDGWSCIKPQTCGKGEISIDRSENGSLQNQQSCLTCVGDTKAYSLDRVCRRCNQRVLELTKSSKSGQVSCTCPKVIIQKDGTSLPAEESDGMCFIKRDLIPDVPYSYTIKYSSTQTIESQFFRKHFRAAQALCFKYKNFTACQLLGNLCVLYMYSEDNYVNTRVSRTDACKEYLLLVDKYVGERVQGLRDWPSAMPWLYYHYESPVITLDKTDITDKFTRMKVLKFVLVTYHANGTFINIDEDATVLQMCQIPEHHSTQGYLFTTPYIATCNVGIKDLLRKWKTVFFDLYLRLDNNDLYPIPVLVDNIQFREEYVNRQSDLSKWRLTRRFFLVDNLSGRSKLNKDTAVVQYAEKIEMLLRIRGDGLIYPPLLKIKYAVAGVSGSGSNKVAISFHMSYKMDTDQIHQSIKIAAGVLSVLAMVYASIRLHSWRRREGVVIIDCTSFIKFFLYSCSSLSFVFQILLIGASLQWLFFFKQQTSVIRLLPTLQQEELLKALFIAAFVTKCIDVGHILYSQINIGVFFIDWEKPRVATGNLESGKKGAVSIMRTLFVANEWREIQTLRKINPVLLIVLLLFFLKVVGLEYWTTTDPFNRLTVDRSIDYVGEISFTLRFAVISLLYLIIALVLWVLFGFIYERFVSDQIGDFIDFLSLQNISVFILSHTQFGYYIHGLSVHGRADISMVELYEQFKREEDNLCGPRGLEPSSDRQTFEVAITRKFRNDYDKILQIMMNWDGRREQVPARQNPGAHGTSLSAKVENSVNAYNMMNKYLSAFVEHSIRDNTYHVKDKVFSEKVLQNELYPPTEQCIFYNDDSRSFTNILMYGQELSLLLFYLLLFILIDWVANWNTVLAAIVVYFFDVIIKTSRDYYGSKNLSDKAMVNERFLI